MSRLEAQPERFLPQPTRAFRMGISLLGAVLAMALVVPAEPLGVDQRWSEAMLDSRTSLLTNVALVFNWVGRGLGWMLSLAAVGIVLLIRQRWVALLAFGVTEAVTPLISTLLKILVGRPRPPDGLVHPVGSSFPSGHAAYAGATCVALVLLFTAPGPSRRWWWSLAALGILGMAWSRTYLQVHWLSDVIGGSLLGVGVALSSFAGIQLMYPRIFGRIRMEPAVTPGNEPMPDSPNTVSRGSRHH
jgi:membrane-associated phospholipid phosphatase